MFYLLRIREQSLQVKDTKSSVCLSPLRSFTIGQVNDTLEVPISFY